jgi:hypothetical protein
MTARKPRAWVQVQSTSAYNRGDLLSLSTSATGPTERMGVVVKLDHARGLVQVELLADEGSPMAAARAAKEAP